MLRYPYAPTPQRKCFFGDQLTHDIERGGGENCNVIKWGVHWVNKFGAFVPEPPFELWGGGDLMTS